MEMNSIGLEDFFCRFSGFSKAHKTFVRYAFVYCTPLQTPETRGR